MLASNRNFKSAHSHEYWRQFQRAFDDEDYSKMLMYGREILYNCELTLTDLNRLQEEIEKHCQHADLTDGLRKEIIKRRSKWLV